MTDLSNGNGAKVIRVDADTLSKYQPLYQPAATSANTPGQVVVRAIRPQQAQTVRLVQQVPTRKVIVQRTAGKPGQPVIIHQQPASTSGPSIGQQRIINSQGVTVVRQQISGAPGTAAQNVILRPAQRQQGIPPNTVFTKSQIIQSQNGQVRVVNPTSTISQTTTSQQQQQATVVRQVTSSNTTGGQPVIVRQSGQSLPPGSVIVQRQGVNYILQPKANQQVVQTQKVQVVQETSQASQNESVQAKPQTVEAASSCPTSVTVHPVSKPATDQPSTSEEQEEEPQVDIDINNVVCSFNTRCHLNLKKIATEGLHVIYKRENGVSTNFNM